MTKISRLKCKFCGIHMEKEQTECPSCGKSKNLEVGICVECGAKYEVDPRDSSVRICSNCGKEKSKKRILIKGGIIVAFIAALVTYKLFKIFIT